ncbi:MAG: tetratricopeptide repeat protein [Verrucomicrobiales bacterium]|nr:tetratricopeptide repeat protein [Verrucomicrobiales bacterium]
MKLNLPWLALVALLFAVRAQAMFMWEDTRSVPVVRLIANQEARLTNQPSDAVTLYRLARLHALRATFGSIELNAAKKDQTPVFASAGTDTGIPSEEHPRLQFHDSQERASALTNSLRYYEAALRGLERSANASDHWLILPAHLGYAWTLEQAGRTNDAIREYRRTLTAAWAAEVSISGRDWWERLKESWEARRWLGPPVQVLGPGVCFSEETIRYLLPKLDPVRDASEIADLKRRRARLGSMPRAITPVVIPTGSKRDLNSLVDPRAAVPFDLDGSGLRKRWGWIRDSAVWLVWDPEGTGRITSGLQLFGNVTFWIFWRDGYEVLDALDDNGDGVLSGAELQGLALWRDVNGDGVSDPGEVVSVREAGLTELQCHPEVHSTGIPFHPAGATFQGADVRPTYDWRPTSEGWE